MTLEEYQLPVISLPVFLQSPFTDSMPPTQAAPLLPCGHGPGMKVWCSRYFHSTGGQLFWWSLGCLHVELQHLPGKGLPSGIAVLPWTGLVSFNTLIGMVLDFVSVMSAGQNYAYTIHQQCNSIAKTFPFSFLVVSLCLYPFIFVLSYIWWWIFWSSGVCFYLPYILICSELSGGN